MKRRSCKPWLILRRRASSWLINLAVALLLTILFACGAAEPTSPQGSAATEETNEASAGATDAQAAADRPSAATATSETSAQSNSAASPTADPYADRRRQMVEQQIQTRGVADEKVLAAMATVPRHEFVPADYQEQAYNDHPLPIGYGQTISQPYIVALMTELIDPQPGERVLEIGTGSGYQAAILAQLTDEVYTIEIVPELADRVERVFDRLGYAQITAKQDDGYWGWEEYAPFDAIIVTAAPDHVPQPLVNQLADGGRMVIPIGPPGGYQSLWLFERNGDEIIRINWGGVRFVPFTRE